MPYLLVTLLSIGVGALVYVLSMRASAAEPLAVGFEPDASGAGAMPAELGSAPGYTYLQVAVTRGPSLRERLQGLVGSLVLVVVAAFAVAGTFYALGWLVNRVIQTFLVNEVV
jgi:hypothetical protein